MTDVTDNNRLPVPMWAFAGAALAPVLLFAAAVLWGGGWVWAALVYMGGLTTVLDQLLPMVETDAPEGAEFPAADALLVVAGLSALGLMALCMLALHRPELSGWDKAALVLTAGFWLGQVAHPAAHELIHRSDRRLFRLGVAVYAAMLMGHHASAHRLVHHRHVATPDDPASARAGLGFWRWLPRAWAGGFFAGLQAENALRSRSVHGLDTHPYRVYAAISGLALALAAVLGGAWGVLVWLALGCHAALQIELSDYVQHYGLRRATLPDGKPEPVSARHSWNTAHWFSSALMLNAPRHSDHHAHPSCPYPALRLPADAPRLPWPLPLACLIAMIPPLWHRAMRPHLAAWRAGNVTPN